MLRFPEDFSRCPREREATAADHKALLRRLVGRWWLYVPELGALAWQTYEDYDHDPTDWELNLYLAPEHFVARMPLAGPLKPPPPLTPPCEDTLPASPLLYNTGAEAAALSEAAVAGMVRSVCGGLDEEGYFFSSSGDTLVFGFCDGSPEAVVLVFRGFVHIVVYPEEG